MLPHGPEFKGRSRRAPGSLSASKSLCYAFVMVLCVPQRTLNRVHECNGSPGRKSGLDDVEGGNRWAGQPPRASMNHRNRPLLTFAWAGRAWADSAQCRGAPASRVAADYRRGEALEARRPIEPPTIGSHARRSLGDE